MNTFPALWKSLQSPIQTENIKLPTGGVYIHLFNHPLIWKKLYEAELNYVSVKISQS